MNFKLSVDEDILSVKTSPGLLERLFVFNHWSYRFELPMLRINSIEIENRYGVKTMVIHKKTNEGEEKNIPISLSKASKKQIRFIEEALPQIIEKHLPMPEIKKLQKEYLSQNNVTYL
ncbi:MAG: hypothetical protein N4A46_12235 [Schleiferiaceae bacterium]|jgi:hypothetical protein|nr:hypothetical protein [Schleiferiaceae bacterium]